MNITTIAGGYKVPCDSHLGKWQQECQRLDHDNFTVNAIRPWIGRNSFILDVGAFDGDHTINYSEIASEGFVWAYEPNETAFKCLQHNIALFPNGNVYATNSALGAKNETLGMLENSNLGASRLTGDGVMTVPVFSLDTMNMEKLDFIKMDCEGFEPNVIRGAIMTLERLKPVLLIEINRHALQDQGFTVDDIYDPLTEIGYEFQIIQPDAKPEDVMFDVLAFCR